MKKPDYIEIELPVKKKYHSTAVTKYFKLLENKVLEIKFAKGGRRSVFKYRVWEVYPEKWTNWETKKERSIIKIQLEIIKEE